jgi:hypothetical protein
MESCTRSQPERTVAISEGEIVEGVFGRKGEVKRLGRGSAGGRGEVARVADLHRFSWCA